LEVFCLSAQDPIAGDKAFNIPLKVLDKYWEFPGIYRNKNKFRWQIYKENYQS